MSEYKVHYTVNKYGYPDYGDVNTEDGLLYFDVGSVDDEQAAKFLSLCHYLENADIPIKAKTIFCDAHEVKITEEDWGVYHDWRLTQPIEVEPFEHYDEAKEFDSFIFIDPFKDEMDPISLEILNDIINADFSFGKEPKKAPKDRFPVKYSDNNKRIIIGYVEDPNVARQFSICAYLVSDKVSPEKKLAYKAKFSKGDNDNLEAWIKRYHEWKQEKADQSKTNKKPQLTKAVLKRPVGSSSATPKSRSGKRPGKR